MGEDPPKKEMPSEVMIPTAPSIPQGTICIENTISRERFAQLSGVEPPQICAAATAAEAEARKQLNDDKSDRWLYFAARGKLELELLLEIRRYERIGTLMGYDVCGLKKTNRELAAFFNVGSDSMSRTKNALLRRGLIDAVDGVLQLRYYAILKAAKAKGWCFNRRSK